jgi:hypothetical protein
LLFQLRLDNLLQLVPILCRRDQTLAYFGFSEEELGALVRSLSGKAIDRLVPVGQALQFNRIWDGYDLVTEFTRIVSVEPVNQGGAATRTPHL